MKDMAVLPGHEVLKMSAVLGLLDSTIQIQPAGVDLTVGEIYRFRGCGFLGFSNEARMLPEVEKLEFDHGKLFLERGAYRVRYNEVVRVPSDCVAISLPRSSLMRMGATVISALWDPGYEGRGEGLLIVENPHGIVLEKDARVVQLIFIKLASKPLSEYRGVYMHEGLEPT
jgi:dUTP pyrophosphatase